jgi:urease accessory protein
MRIRLALAVAVTMVPTAAFAHPGGPGDFSFANGLVHPLTGADHLAAALLVGALAALCRRTGAVLAGFLGAVAAGLLVGSALPHGMATPAELGIMLGFAAIAAAFLLRSRLAWLPSLAAATAGSAHGLVHASEGAAALGFAAGVLVASAALTGAGYLAARCAAGRRAAGQPSVLDRPGMG